MITKAVVVAARPEARMELSSVRQCRQKTYLPARLITNKADGGILI